MKISCSKCGTTLNTGESIVQIARGKYIQGAITPTYAHGLKVLHELHESCFNVNNYEPQLLPYHCVICKELIDHNADVVYAVIGTKPNTKYIRPESRGYQMPYIAHENCYHDSPII